MGCKACPPEHPFLHAKQREYARIVHRNHTEAILSAKPHGATTRSSLIEREMTVHAAIVAPIMSCAVRLAKEKTEVFVEHYLARLVLALVYTYERGEICSKNTSYKS